MDAAIQSNPVVRPFQYLAAIHGSDLVAIGDEGGLAPVSSGLDLGG